MSTNFQFLIPRGSCFFFFLILAVSSGITFFNVTYLYCYLLIFLFQILTVYLLLWNMKHHLFPVITSLRHPNPLQTYTLSLLIFPI